MLDFMTDLTETNGGARTDERESLLSSSRRRQG
jgi:hypothetical protein